MVCYQGKYGVYWFLALTSCCFILQPSSSKYRCLLFILVKLLAGCQHVCDLSNEIKIISDSFVSRRGTVQCSDLGLHLKVSTRLPDRRQRLCHVSVPASPQEVQASSVHQGLPLRLCVRLTRKCFVPPSKSFLPISLSRHRPQFIANIFI